MEFWAHVEQLRKNQKVTQINFAKEIGVSTATYANYLEKEPSPTLKQIETVSKVLGTDLFESLICSKFKQPVEVKKESESDAIRRLSDVFERVLASKEVEIDRLAKHQSWLEKLVDGLNNRLATAK